MTVKHRYIISSIAALERHAKECRTPIIERGRQEVEEGSARDALVAYLEDVPKAYIPSGDYYDTAVAYEAADPTRPLVWLATREP